MKTLCALVLILLLSSCTFRSQEPLPDEKAYAENSGLLVNTSQKLADEPDAKKLHEIAMALQTTRTLSCSDYNDECSLFGKFLSLAAQLSNKGSMSMTDRRRLQDKAAEIRLKVELGKRRLREEIEQKQKKK